MKPAAEPQYVTVDLAVERARADHAEPSTEEMLLRGLAAARERPRAHYVFLSQWELDVLSATERGSTVYLAMKRADLNERRRREAAPLIGQGSVWGIHRSVAGQA